MKLSFFLTFPAMQEQLEAVWDASTRDIFNN